MKIGAVVDTPKGRGVFVGNGFDGGLVVVLDEDAEKQPIEAWQFEPGEVKPALDMMGGKSSE